MLAGCGGGTTSLGLQGSAPRAVPPPEMNGRWMLSAAAGGACGMTFAGTPGASEGAIRPEGGCPGNFFTSRKWTFEGGALLLRNHNGEPLAQLTEAAPGRFDGQATAGAPVSLAR
jgi:Protease inhibitor Inh